MKKIIKILLSLLLVVSFNSCTDGNTVGTQVLETFETGAILRTLEIVSSTLNSSEPSSSWGVMVEEQDGEDGALFQSVEILVSIRDLTSDNGTSVADDKLIKTVDAASFTPGPHGLPRGSLSATFGEAAAALGLPASGIAPGDVFVFEIRVVLTDGRSFGADEAGGTVTGGFFDAPHRYNALIVCTPQSGDYSVTMVDNYGDGWQGSKVRAIADGVNIDSFIPDYWGADPATRGNVGDTQWILVQATVNIPAGTELAVWEFVPGDFPSEVEFEIFDPFGGTFGYFGPSAPGGLLPVLLCATN